MPASRLTNNRFQMPENKTPTKFVCVTLMVPDDPIHFANFRGALGELYQARAYAEDPDKSASKVARYWQHVIMGMKVDSCNPTLTPVGEIGDCMLIRQNPDNPCLIEQSANGTDWCAFIDLSLCQNFGAQPGQGSSGPPPAPGGGEQQTCSKLNANSTLLLPALVNTGDTITLNSVSGAGWDGGEFDFGPLWRLPNGDQFVGGLDVGFPHVTGTDPLVATNHMQIIAAIGSTPVYIPLVAGSAATVPGGVSNAQVYLQVNDSALANNQGDYQVCVTVKNNQPGVWTHTSDFTKSPDGWYPRNDGGLDQAIWQPSVGWVPNPAYNLGVVNIRHAMAASVTNVRAVLNDSAAPQISSGFAAFNLADTFFFFDTNPIPAAGDNVGTFSGTHASNIIELNSDDNASAATLTWKSCHLEGTGTNPF